MEKQQGSDNLSLSLFQQVQCLHASYYLLQTEQAEPHFTGTAGAKWLDQLEQEYDNVRRALRWYLECKEWENALRLGGALRDFWILNGHGHEGYQWMTEILAGSDGCTTQSRAKALLTTSMLAYYHGEYTRWSILSRESLQLFQILGDRRGIDNSRGVARTLSLLAFIAGYDQEHSNAIKLAEESLDIFKAIGEQWKVARQLHYVGELALRQNDAEHALAYVEESLHISQQIGNREAIARAYHLLAQVEQKRQGVIIARPLLERSLVLYEEIDNQEGAALVLLNMAQEALQYKKYPQARVLLERCFRILVQKENKAALIENLRALAQLAVAERRIDWAVHLLGASDALRQVSGCQPLTLKNAYRLITTMTINPPNEQVFAVSWAEGRSMTPKQVFTMQELTIISQHTGQQAPTLQTGPTRLTTRELEVLRLISQGLTNPQIAKLLVISPVTVNSHVRSIYNKFEVTTRSAATNYALRNQLVWVGSYFIKYFLFLILV